ncbi:oxidoreductase [Mesorhizobium sp. 131-3-5]|uniref:Gfo/Idh/MocA family protein n=1 Tax=Mesorhizobium sp. 131-3-5 TaxID=2744520 RepID=UPI00192924F2|nr:Gfo/Idh/MocA family oxidoreductase [Mesorhizobium sp. 131-3-5]BCH08462.1 oxidoreductase [Mesorhizobium sp. 131-3-5]
MPRKDEKRLRVGVLGCGPIAQAAHFESCTKARNADLYAICDVADDLRDRMAATFAPEKSYADYGQMLADPDLDAVIIATSDTFHVKAAELALDAGKHVLCEKPLGVSVEEVEGLRAAVDKSGKVLQVGHMKRFDPGIQAAKAFVDDEMGERLAFKGWYCDSTHRYPMTDAVQPLIITSAKARKPSVNPKADLRQYYMLAHGSHLLDTARHLHGPIEAVEARLTERYGAYCWFVTTIFADGSVGHFDLTVAVRMDWHEGFQIYGQNGSVLAKTFNPWYYKSSEVDIFREADGSWHRTLGADGHFYRRQLEGFADVVLNGAPMVGAGIEDGIASVRGMAAIARSAAAGGRIVDLADVDGVV